MFGANSILYLKDYQAAVKTGTTQKLNNAWAMGYTANLVTGVWVGNNDNSPMQKPGSSLAGPIWREFMLFALESLPKTLKNPYLLQLKNQCCQERRLKSLIQFCIL